MTGVGRGSNWQSLTCLVGYSLKRDKQTKQWDGFESPTRSAFLLLGFFAFVLGVLMFVVSYPILTLLVVVKLVQAIRRRTLLGRPP